jgi:polar amino acid transport system permease protein
MDFELIAKSIPNLLKGLGITMELGILGVFIGSILGTLAGLARLSKRRILKWIAIAYSDFFRGTPMIVQLFIVYFALPALLKINIESFLACAIVCSTNSGAYISEVVRAGILGVDRGQTEAGKSLGLNNFQILYNIVFPQAIKRILPAMGNEFIGLIKGTSIVSVIGMRELTGEGQIIISRTYASLEIWLLVATFYLILIMTLSRLVNFLERRLND